MKVVNLHAEHDKLIKKAQKQDRVSQFRLYEKHAPKMLGVIRYYIKDLQHAEDILQNAFCKAFINLKSYQFKGSFEGWLRRIVVRQSIDFLRQQKKMMIPTEDFSYYKTAENPLDEVSDISHIQKAIDQLPAGYKTVFCLYVLEEFKHKDIAELLNIDIGTSKSQLYKARKMLKDELKKDQLKSSK
ncbi:MAG: RNA polymerase sigma factor [Psychroflexus sp.]|nr:RNA polymerase sigma factor [Psychroflexus sp.]